MPGMHVMQKICWGGRVAKLHSTANNLQIFGVDVCRTSYSNSPITKLLEPLTEKWRKTYIIIANPKSPVLRGINFGSVCSPVSTARCSRNKRPFTCNPSSPTIGRSLKFTPATRPHYMSVFNARSRSPAFRLDHPWVPVSVNWEIHPPSRR